MGKLDKWPTTALSPVLWNMYTDNQSNIGLHMGDSQS